MTVMTAAKAPAGLLGAALLLWGFSIGLPWLGAGIAIAFEALRWVAPGASAGAAARAALVARACAVLWLVSLVLLLATQGPPQALYSWLRWLPLLLLPLPLLQLLAGRLALGDLLKGDGEDRREIDLTHAHAALTLAAAGTGAGTGMGTLGPQWLYPSFVLILGWALLVRQARERRALAATMLVLASGIGYAVHTGISALQGQVEEWGTELIADWLSAPQDPFRERTRIGDLGRIKLSDRIVMRVKAGDATPEREARPSALPAQGASPTPLLLRESVFDRYQSGEWRSGRRASRPAARAGEADWLLEGDGKASPAVTYRRIEVRRSLPGGEGLLPLPLGTQRIESLPADAVEVLASGTVRAQGTPRFVALGAIYDEAAEGGPPDRSVDLEVPALLAPTLTRLVDAEHLRRATPGAAVDALRDFFGAKFAYSLNLGESRVGGAGGGRTLADFLLRDRQGHCEFFATATVLLLREAGIPARYVVGYSAQEFSPREQALVVRARHAHAWAQAWVDGRWLQIDTTPSRWAEAEREAAQGPLTPLLDWASWWLDRALQILLAAAAAPWTIGAGVLAGVLVGLAALLSAPPLWRLIKRRRQTRRNAAGESAQDAIAKAWAQVERSVAQVGGPPRAADETVRAWIERVSRTEARPQRQAALLELGQAYYRARFDPSPAAGQSAEFVSAAQAWVAAAATDGRHAG